jgi:hypothetical protein
MNLARDRIIQGRFFLRKAEEAGFSNRDAFRYFIEASIVAGRSVTLLLQKQYHGVPGFQEWYTSIQDRLRADPLARFLLEKRNFVLKEGTVSVRKVINVTLHEVVEVNEAFGIKVIRGSWKSRLKHLPSDLIYPLREKWSELKRRYQHSRRRHEQQPAEISEAYFFQESEWSTTSATQLLKRQLDSLESIVNVCVERFGEPSIGTNGA